MGSVKRYSYISMVAGGGTMYDELGEIVIFPCSVVLRNRGSFVAFTTNSHATAVGAGEVVMVDGADSVVGIDDLAEDVAVGIIEYVGDTTGWPETTFS